MPEIVEPRGPHRLLAIIADARLRARKRRTILALVAVACAAIGVAVWRDHSGGGGGIAADPEAATPRVAVEREANGMGSFSDASIAAFCTEGVVPKFCKLVKAFRADIVVPGEQLTNRELQDVLRHVDGGPAVPLASDDLAAQPLLEICRVKVGNGKPPWPACEWALENQAEIDAAAR